MFDDLFIPGPIPHNGYNKLDKNRNYKSNSPIIAGHAEIPRPEYSYQWNEDGLRSVDFSQKPNIVVIGCSLTLGQGLPENLRWSNLLQERIGYGKYLIGNISYSGAAVNKLVSSFFGLINKYDYVPEIVICNFANFERFYFVSPDATHLQDWYINYSPKKTKVSAPWNYQEILPYEWVYYQNLDHLKMLETFCNSHKIKMIWSSWSNALTEDNERFLESNFKNYVRDYTRKEFPPDFEFTIDLVKREKLLPYYQMNNWNDIMCHKEYNDKYPEIFDMAYDYHMIKGPWGPGSHRPHPGIHRQLHWEEFYYNELVKRDWI
jgi:hypothetical protein